VQETAHVQKVIELDKKSGEFVLDESGYLRFIPSAAEMKAINRFLADEITAAETAHEPIFAEAAENIETYKAIKIGLPDGSGQAIMPSPIARVPADQIIASIVNQVMRPQHVVSVDPHFPAKYPVAVPATIDPADPETAPIAMQMGVKAPVTVAMPLEKDAEEIARRFEQGLDFKLRERLDFEKVFHECVHDCVTGASPTWIKVCRERKRRPIIAPKKKGAFLDFSETEERYVDDGEDVKFYRVPVFNVLRPNLEDDIDSLEWIAERDPKDPSDIISGFHAEDYFLIKNEDEAKKLAAIVSGAQAPEKER
jgi:hypothetical protein